MLYVFLSVSLKTNFIAHPFLILLYYMYLYVRKRTSHEYFKKYCMCKICEQGMQLNDTFSFNKNLIYYMIINVLNNYSSTHIYYPLLIPICFHRHHYTPHSSTKIHLCINVGFCYTLKSTSIFTNLSLWTVKYGHESYGTRTRKWLSWRGPGEIVNDRPVLSSERAPHINKSATVWQ
jgi:hypothetical protein